MDKLDYEDVKLIEVSWNAGLRKFGGGAIAKAENMPEEGWCLSVGYVAGKDKDFVLLSSTLIDRVPDLNKVIRIPRECVTGLRKLS